MCLTRMESEHFWDTPPNNLLSRLKHRGGGMRKILRLTRQIIGTFYSPGGGLVGGGELNYLDPKNVRYIFGVFKLFLA